MISSAGALSLRSPRRKGFGGRRASWREATGEGWPSAFEAKYRQPIDAPLLVVPPSLFEDAPSKRQGRKVHSDGGDQLRPAGVDPLDEGAELRLELSEIAERATCFRCSGIRASASGLGGKFRIRPC